LISKLLFSIYTTIVRQKTPHAILLPRQPEFHLNSNKTIKGVKILKFSKFMFFFMTIVLTAALVVINASAQEASLAESTSTPPNDDHSNQTDAVSDQLKQADTSSPRDTLRSFLTDMAITLDDWQQNEHVTSSDGFRASERAIATLDLSTTPYSDARMVISRRILMLLEILGRIGLPPYSEIPGDAEVAQGDLNRWTIPGAGITIQRIENGPRADEFLFSAWTVRHIPRFYHQIKHLPYKPHALPGAYEAYLRSKNTVIRFSSRHGDGNG
jgi:MscS family membrane protein